MWACLVTYLAVVVTAPFLPWMGNHIEITLQALVAILLLGWAIDLRTKDVQPKCKKLLLYAAFGHSLWIAITDGRIRYTPTYAKGEALTFAAICAAIIFFERHRGSTWTKKSA